MTRAKKLFKLQDEGVVKEECPSPNYWTFRVLKPELLPEEFREEYEKEKCLRIYWS